MKSAQKGTMVALLAFALVFVGGIAQGQETSMTTYNRIDEVMDWGAVTTMLVVDLQTEVSQGTVDASSFSVFVQRSDPRLAQPFLEEGNANVVDAYISDADGNPVDMGSYATLKIEVGPTITLSSALNYDWAGSGLNEWTENVYTITQEKAIGNVEGLVATEMDQYSRLLVDDYSFGNASYEDEEFGLIELPYAHYAPADDAAHPLIIWLHGGGEGGSDPTIPLAANKATVFVTEEVQAYFGGAYVLAPQAPTMWLDDGSGTYEGENVGIISKYTRALQDLVESFVAENPNIDTNRIYVTGASNGGFMTVRLILDYPDFYAAAIPICEPLDNESVSDEGLAEILDMPIWFVTAASDFVVQPSAYPVKLYDRMIQAGASNTYMSYLPKVIDESGLYTNENGSPYEYLGHWSWIYFYNNDLAQIMDGETVVGRLYGSAAQSHDDAITIMEWLAAQSK